jgi:hypothetical protein
MHIKEAISRIVDRVEGLVHAAGLDSCHDRRVGIENAVSDASREARHVPVPMTD